MFKKENNSEDTFNVEESKTNSKESLSKKTFDTKDFENISKKNKRFKFPKVIGNMKNYLKKFFPRRVKPVDQEKNKGPKI